MDAWDGAILAVAGFVAVSSLVRLMIARRNTLSAKLRQQYQAEQRRKKKDGQPARGTGKTAA